MGTYTTNYQLYTPTVGETGWGTLVNGNFTTIDTTMKSLSNRITAVENEVNGALSCTSVTTSGKITGNGGIAGTTGTFSGAVTGKTFNGVVLKSSGTITVKPNSTIMGYLPLDYVSYASTPVLPPLANNVTYTGSIKLHSYRASGTSTVYYINGVSTGAPTSVSVTAGSDYTLSFTKIPYLILGAHYDEEVKYYGFTFS